jgi:histidinol-phosphate aminotransferase
MSEYVRYSIATDEQLDELTQIVQDWRKQYEISKNA